MTQNGEVAIARNVLKKMETGENSTLTLATEDRVER